MRVKSFISIYFRLCVNPATYLRKSDTSNQEMIQLLFDY